MVGRTDELINGRTLRRLLVDRLVEGGGTTEVCLIQQTKRWGK